MSFKANRRLFVAVLTTFILIFLWCHYSSRTLIYDKPIPYVFNRHFRKTLDLFAAQSTHKEVLVIHGPQGNGKTRGLRQFVEEASHSHFVVRLDFMVLSRMSSLDEVINQYIRIDQLHSTVVDVARRASSVGARAQIRAMSSVSNAVKEFANELSIGLLLEALDSLAGLNPLLVVHNIEHLMDSENAEVREFGERFWTVCHEFVSDFTTVGIVFEVSNERFLVNRSGMTTRLFYVDEFDANEACAIFAKERRFTKAALKVIRDKVGGYGQGYAELHDIMHNGTNVHDAVLRVEQKVKDRLLKAVAGKKERLTFVREIHRIGTIAISRDLDTAVSLMNRKIVALLNSTHCRLSNELVTKAVLQYKA